MQFCFSMDRGSIAHCASADSRVAASPIISPSLQALNKAADAASVAIKGHGSEAATRYVAGMAANLIDVKNFEEAEWTQVGASWGLTRPFELLLLLVVV
jgi:hypothetical protein